MSASERERERGRGQKNYDISNDVQFWIFVVFRK